MEDRYVVLEMVFLAIKYHITDHIGSVRAVLNQSMTVIEQNDYYPFGLRHPNSALKTTANRYRYNGKEEIAADATSDYGARQYSAEFCQWLQVDPLAEKYYSWSPYNFCVGNPMRYVDNDGREPNKPLIGTVSQFKTLLDNSPRKVGTYTKEKANNYLKSLGNTKFSWKQMRPLPTETGYFNNKKGRYIYTKKGGWIDMAHFMFYAGTAYRYKLEHNENPIGDAIQDGYKQEFSDKFAAKHSAYSYEDLPSDKFGADFAVNHFDPNSELSFGEQLMNYLNNVLNATDPQNAPNYEQLPTIEPETPTQTNTTTTPIYTIEEN
ncbi:MAG: hypothetical protein J6X32_09840 [Salinivirgaceae bacterium]|nr:hypothetical protein [Salinivirgaceae bacterium]